MTTADDVLAYENMTRRYGKVTAVDALTLSARRGELFGLIGPDGAGKTTALRVALGLVRPHGGRVLTCGLDPAREHRKVSRKTGYLSQRFSLYGDLTVDENMAFFAEIHGVRAWRGRRDELLDLVRLTPFRGRLADRLSGGMRQKLALACTLVHRPELLILDEPTTGVDPVSRREFWRLLSGIQGGGLTIVMTTAYLDEAERCGRVALLHAGRLLAQGDPRALRREHPEEIVEVAAKPRGRAVEVLRQTRGVLRVLAFGERLHVSLPRPASTPPDAAAAVRGVVQALTSAGIEVESAAPFAPSLEDVLLRHIREREGPIDTPVQEVLSR